VVSLELLAKVHNLPFERLRVNGLRLKLFSFSVRGELVEPQKILLQEPPLFPETKMFFSTTKLEMIPFFYKDPCAGRNFPPFTFAKN
jgi:hypothetical protein